MFPIHCYEAVLCILVFIRLFSGLTADLENEHFPAMLSAEQVATLQSATQLEADAFGFKLLPLIAAYVRTDLFYVDVGAIARSVRDNWHFGANMRFISATMQKTVHVEQSAISHGWVRGETALESVTVNYIPFSHL